VFELLTPRHRVIPRRLLNAPNLPYWPYPDLNGAQGHNFKVVLGKFRRGLATVLIGHGLRWLRLAEVSDRSGL